MVEAVMASVLSERVSGMSICIYNYMPAAGVPDGIEPINSGSV
jgi:hypothetical protein